MIPISGTTRVFPVSGWPVEQAPFYMERFGWPSVTADEFRALGVL